MARNVTAAAIGPVPAWWGASVRICRRTASNMPSARPGSRCSGGVDRIVRTVPVPAAWMRSTARCSLTRSRPLTASLWIRACRTCLPDCAAGERDPRPGSLKSRNRVGLATPKSICICQPARRSSSGSTSSADAASTIATLEQTVLVAEQAVDRRRLHTGPLGNPACGDRRRPALPQESSRDVDDPRPNVARAARQMSHLSTITRDSYRRYLH